MGKNNFAKLLKDAKDMGRFEGMLAYIEVALVAIHNISVDEEIPEEVEKKICASLGKEAERILQIREGMSAEDIGETVVHYAARLKGEST